MPRPGEDRSNVGWAGQFNNIGPVPLSSHQEDPKEQTIRRAVRVVGDETFQKRLQGYQGRAVQRRRGRPPKRGGQAADISS